MFSRYIPVFSIYQSLQLLEYHGVVALGVIFEIRSQVPRFVISIGGGYYAPHILPK
jgi:hypothetical protein